jgi:protein-arginine deiminase
LEGKAEWTSDRGAIFLANIGDSDNRCANITNDSTPEADLDNCHDASDNILRNPMYLAPLLTVPIAELSQAATGSIAVVESDAAPNVRIFSKGQTGDWTFVDANYAFTADELIQGLELGIDARDVRRNGVWDGRATVKFTVTNGDEVVEDTVALRVAPVLAHHHAQAAERVFVTKPFAGDPWVQFVKELKQNTANAGITAPVYEFDDSDLWTQDFFEAGYTSMPGPDGPVVLRVMIRSAQQFRPAGGQVFKDIRNEFVGAVQTIDNGFTTDSTGNLEVIPPYSLNGKSYPAGRIIMGTKLNEAPLILPFLHAQEAQDPVDLDTDWLEVGHVDEFLQFLPFDNERGWVLLADNPLLGLEILEQAVVDGHGNESSLSRPRFDYDEGQCLPNLTISQVLALDNFTTINELAAQRIENNLEILKRETGITDDEIFRIPALFYFQGFDCNLDVSSGRLATSQEGPLNILHAATPPGLERRQISGPEMRQVFAFYPGIINGVVLSDSAVLSPNPWGPIVDGVDVLATVAEEVYAKVGYNVTWQDDWFSYHFGLGEIHCGTNVWRNADAPWW